MSGAFPTAPDKGALEHGEALAPRFDANGLIAAVVASVAIIRMSQRDDGRRLLARIARVRFQEGKKSSATLKDGVLRIVVSPREGLAGRPSSDRIVKVALAR